MLHTSVVHDEKNDELNVFCLNINKENMPLSMDMRSFGCLSMIEHICLDGDNLHAVNSFEKSDTVLPKKLETVKGSIDIIELVIPKHSWNVLRFALKA